MVHHLPLLPLPTAQIALAAKLEFSSNDRSRKPEAGQAGTNTGAEAEQPCLRRIGLPLFF
jgi:hypothetical protein